MKIEFRIFKAASCDDDRFESALFNCLDEVKAIAKDHGVQVKIEHNNKIVIEALSNEGAFTTNKIKRIFSPAFANGFDPFEPSFSIVKVIPPSK